MPLGKIGGQYVTSQLVSVEARENGFGEGILLDERGNVCEGAGENLFIVLDGRILTPAMASSILGGITRDSAIRIARDLGIEVVCEPISRDMLYLADEIGTGENGDHAGHRAGGFGIDGDDPAMGDRRADKGRMNHPRQLDVVDVIAFALGEPGVLDPLAGASEPLEIGGACFAIVQVFHSAASLAEFISAAAASTDLTMF